MNSYSFFCFGHPNIRSTHRNTIEFTKDSELTPAGDCIIGVMADFELSKLKQQFHYKKLKLTMQVAGVTETVIFEPNPGFKDNHEIVIRRTGFISDRTLGIHADKSAKDLKKSFTEQLKKPQKIKVTICASS